MASGNYSENLTKEKITFHLIEWIFLTEQEQVRQIKKIPEEKKIKLNIINNKSLQMIPHLKLQTSIKFNQKKPKLIFNNLRFHECLPCHQ